MGGIQLLGDHTRPRPRLNSARIFSTQIALQTPKVCLDLLLKQPLTAASSGYSPQAVKVQSKPSLEQGCSTELSIKLSLTFISSVTVVPIQVLNGHLWLVSTLLVWVCSQGFSSQSIILQWSSKGFPRKKKTKEAGLQQLPIPLTF